MKWFFLVFVLFVLGLHTSCENSSYASEEKYFDSSVLISTKISSPLLSIGRRISFADETMLNIKENFDSVEEKLIKCKNAYLKRN